MPHLNPYLEFGYGFATHLFDVGVFIGNEKVNLPPWDVNLPSNYSTNKIVAYTNSSEVYPCGRGRQLYPEAMISP